MVMAVVLLELDLTRLFSVSAGYHFAFMIVSITMFGLTIGALVTILMVGEEEEKVRSSLHLNSALFGLSVPLSLALQIFINRQMEAIGPFWWIGITFLTFSVVFYFAGVCLSLCLSRFQSVGRLYCIDLLGAAVSCPLLVLGLTMTSALNVMIICGLLAAVASLVFRAQSHNPRTIISSALPLVVCTAMLFVPLPVFKKVTNAPVEFEKWTPLGRVIVTDERIAEFTWGKNQDPIKVKQKALFIDSGAMTVITKYSDKPGALQSLRKDLTAVGNQLRPGGELFVIGAGGGRDIITGLLYEQKVIDAAEVNPAIVDMIKGRYSDFVGKLHERKGVNIVNDEARVWLARSDRKYSLIQCSLVDTWAASSSGAFMLTENSLYTREAFELYLSKLKPNGVFSVIRWGDEKQPSELLRIAGLARCAMNAQGIEDTSSRVMLISAASTFEEANMGLLLVSPSPFSGEDIEKIKEICQQRDYKILWLPDGAGVEPFISFMKNPNPEADLPTDDRPFFFSTFGHAQDLNRGMALLAFTLLLSIVLVAFSIVVPLWLTVGRNLRKEGFFFPSMLYFSALGIGFMLIEVGLIQRLTIFLGSPTYGLTVVLFALLLASGAGSFFAQRRIDAGSTPARLASTGTLLSSVSALAITFLSLYVVSAFPTQTLMTKVLISIVMVGIPGFFLGWCFPLGMITFGEKDVKSGAWYWGINGATSVLGSVAAAMISMQFGITYTLAIGACVYLIAAGIMFFKSKGEEAK